MSGFADQLLLRFLDNSFVNDLLTNKVGLADLFNTTYEVDTIDVRQLDLALVQRKEFVFPAFETIRTSGTDERIIPATERVKVDRTQPEQLQAHDLRLYLFRGVSPTLWTVVKGETGSCLRRPFVDELLVSR